MASARTWLLAQILVLVAGSAAGGAWPRAPGDVFLSFSGERDRTGNSYISAYGEFGLTPRNTLGIEAGRSAAGETSALIWLRRALDRGEGPDRWAATLGAGAILRDGETLPVGQVGLAWGRGLEAVPLLSRIPGGGWLGAEARVKVAGAMKDEQALQELAAAGAGPLAYLTPEVETKLELTLGWHATPLTMLVGQLRLEERDDTGFSSKLAASLVRDLPGALRMEVGVVAPITGTGEQALKIGTWLEF